MRDFELDTLSDLSEADLAQLALEFLGPDATIADFRRDYEYYQDWISAKERQLREEEEEDWGGPYVCWRCGHDIRDEYDPVAEAWSTQYKPWIHGGTDPEPIEVIRQRFACWEHLHDSGRTCSYCDHILSKED